MRILIETPTAGGSVWDESADSITANAIQAVKAGHEVDKKSVRGYQIGPNRTRMADKAVEGGYDYILMVDSDVVLPDGALLMLLEHEADVCLGYYAHQGKTDGTTCLCKEGRVNYDRQFNAAELRAMRERGDYTLKVKGGGMGCALIRTDVFKRISYPYYKWIDYADRHGTLSEDLYFCEECHRAGIQIYADTRVACGHFLRIRQEVL